MVYPLKITTDSDRNLENLQALIDNLAQDLSQYRTKNMIRKAQAFEILGRLIEKKEALQHKQDKRQSMNLSRIASYLMRKGGMTRRELAKSGCYHGNVRVLDEALSILEELGLLEVTMNKFKGDITYQINEPNLQLKEYSEN